MAGEDPQYTAWLKTQPCCKCGTMHDSRVPHHRSGAGMGLREHDHKAMPMCHQCHHDFHALSGPFKRWTKAHLVAWQDEKISYYRAVYGNDMPF